MEEEHKAHEALQRDVPLDTLAIGLISVGITQTQAGNALAGVILVICGIVVIFLKYFTRIRAKA